MSEVEIDERRKAAKIRRNAADEVATGEPENTKLREVGEGGRKEGGRERVIRKIKVAKGRYIGEKGRKGTGELVVHQRDGAEARELAERRRYVAGEVVGREVEVQELGEERGERRREGAEEDVHSEDEVGEGGAAKEGGGGERGVEIVVSKREGGEVRETTKRRGEGPCEVKVGEVQRGDGERGGAAGNSSPVAWGGV